MAEKLALAPIATLCVLGLQITWDGVVTVNAIALLAPDDVVTVTLRAPSAAAASTTKPALSEVLLVTVTLVAVTPAPLTVTVVAPTTKLVPVRI